MAIEVFNNGAHRIIRFDDLTEPGDVQANQFLVIHGDKGMLLDPGGNKMVAQFIDWVAQLKCGVDWLTEQNWYRLPTNQ